MSALADMQASGCQVGVVVGVILVHSPRGDSGSGSGHCRLCCGARILFPANPGPRPLSPRAPGGGPPSLGRLGLWHLCWRSCLCPWLSAPARRGCKLQQRVPDVFGGDPLPLTHPKGGAHTWGCSY